MIYFKHFILTIVHFLIVYTLSRKHILAHHNGSSHLCTLNLIMQQVVLITGASSGIGKAIAEYLVTKNYCVYGTSRNPKTAVINGVNLIALDVTVPSTISLAVKTVIEQQGKIDFLINNAGMGITGPLEETPLNELKKVFDTNYFGPLAVIQEVLPFMRAKRCGMVINITSIAGYMGLPFRGGYSATKGALGITTEAYRMELRNFGITMTNVAPGDFATNIAAGRYHSPLKEGSPYYKTYGDSLKLMDAHVSHGQSPLLMAKAIFKVMNTANPKVHYSVGAFMQKLSIVLKKILPDRLYERLLVNHYKL